MFSTKTISTRSLFILIVIIIIVADGAYFLFKYRQSSLSPEVIVTSPTADDVWTIGSTHNIVWDTKNIPSENKISITITRIPPPPLQTEGQEFDPILFVNLKNTGSVEWTIADQYPAGTYVLGVNSYPSVPVVESISGQSAPFRIIKEKNFPAEIYPLYPGISWGSEMAATDTMPINGIQTVFTGYRVVSQTVKNITNIAAVTTPFEKYYRDKLKTAGWVIDNNLLASGPGSDIVVYTKGDDYMVISFATVFHAGGVNEPVQCPCDTTLSIFDGKP